MLKHRARAVFLIIFAALIGYFVYQSQLPGGKYPFRLGLDLSGGTHLVYKADVSRVDAADLSGSMTTLRDVVEQRVNTFHVSEPIVQTQQGGGLSSADAAYKLIVELPGITNVDEAVKAIGATPSLEFRLATAADVKAFNASSSTAYATTSEREAAYNAMFKETGLTGRMVSRANLERNNTTQEPVVGLTFNADGRDLFDKITKENVGNYLGIFLDGRVISAPVLREEISEGKAQISGSFTVADATTLVRNLNYGALPIPITLISTQSIGPSLGAAAVKGGVLAGIIAFLIISIFLIIWYRLPGLVAVVALGCYVVVSLAVFKIGISPSIVILAIIFVIFSKWVHWSFIFGIPVAYIAFALMGHGLLSPVTLTAAGIAGFILSVGMAVDANILIFERMKEELRAGRGIWDAMHEGFARAWTSIRDSNISSIITGLILYLFGSTSVITGFALVFLIGVAISMFTAITASRLFLYAVAPSRTNRFTTFLISNGFGRLGSAKASKSSK